MKRSSVPLLKQENIQELNEMIVSIMEENNVKLEKIYENQAIIEQTQMNEFSLQAMYNVAVTQFHKKQKIIDNMCHFSLSLMNTVDILWQQKDDLEVKIHDINQEIQKLNEHIYQKQNENQTLKNRLQQADLCIDQLIQEKQKIQKDLSKANKFQQELANFQFLENQKLKEKKDYMNIKDEDKVNVKQQVQEDINEEEEEERQLQESIKEEEEKQLQESIIKSSIQVIKNSGINISILDNDFMWKQQKLEKQNQKTKNQTEENSLEQKKSDTQKKLNKNPILEQNKNSILDQNQNPILDQNQNPILDQNQNQNQKVNFKLNMQRNVIQQKISQQKQINILKKQKIQIGIGIDLGIENRIGIENEIQVFEEQNIQTQHQNNLTFTSEYGSCIQIPNQSFFKQQTYSRQNSSILTCSKSGLQPILTKTKSLQVCLFEKQPIFKPIMKKNVEKKNVGTQANTKLLKKQSLNTAQTQTDSSIMSFLNKSFSMSQLKQDNRLKKDEQNKFMSMNKLFGYFTNKVVKNRIKINKKNISNQNISNSKLQKSSILLMNESKPTFKKMVK